MTEVQLNYSQLNLNKTCFKMITIMLHLILCQKVAAKNYFSSGDCTYLWPETSLSSRRLCSMKGKLCLYPVQNTITSNSLLDPSLKLTLLPSTWVRSALSSTGWHQFRPMELLQLMVIPLALALIPCKARSSAEKDPPIKRTDFPSNSSACLK